MDIPVISGNTQSADMSAIGLNSVVPPAAGGSSASDFISSMKQSQVAADPRCDGSAGKNSTPAKIDSENPETDDSAHVIYAYMTAMAHLNGLAVGEKTAGLEPGGSLLNQSAAEASPVLGSGEPQAAGELPLERLLEQLKAHSSGNSGDNPAGELAAIISSAINGDGSNEGTGTGVVNTMAEDQAVWGATGNQAREQLSLPQTTATNNPPWGQPGRNPFSGNDDALMTSKTMPDQLLAAGGEKMKSTVDFQLHDDHYISLGDILGEKNAATKMVFSQSQGTLDQQPGGQKFPAGASLDFLLSELSAAQGDKGGHAPDAAGQNQFSGLPLPGLEPAVAAGKGENHLPVTSDDLLNQVTMRLPDRHDSRQVVTIQLQPESLGKVEIKLVMEQQKLSAHFVVQHSEVRDVLLKQVSTLHDALVAKGIDVKQVAVEIAPAEKTVGMAVTVDQHPAGGNQTGGFGQFSSGDGRQHTFSAQHQAVVEPLMSDKVTMSAGSSSSEISLQPGSLHIRA